MNDHVNPPQLVHFTFHKLVPVGTPPHEPGDTTHLLVVDDDRLPSWGRLVSFELQILRDGVQALDIQTYSFGVTPLSSGKLNVRFELWDVHVGSIVDHEYNVTAQIHYHPA